MATYIIGDVHGHLDPLLRLLDTIDYDRREDELWFVGDLVNGGPGNVGVLELLRDLPRVRVTLGNHDLHMLAVAHGVRPMRRKDNFTDVLEDPDHLDLLEWLRHCEMAVEGPNHVMVHAGVLPEWNVVGLREAAELVVDALRGNKTARFLDRMYGNTPTRWKKASTRREKKRVAVNALTRMRVCRSNGAMDFSFNGSPKKTPKGLSPWFECRARVWDGPTVVFGHWSALGFRRGKGWIGLDSGIVWGRKLTGICIDTDEVFQIPAAVDRHWQQTW